jgi:LysR family transcriptional regulator (chromosome initiation inhibitor)
MALFGFHSHFPYHLCPSSEGFVRLASAGMGYGMMPQLQTKELMQSGQLVSVAPGYSLSVPLYWHFWRHSGELIQRLTQHLGHIFY